MRSIDVWLRFVSWDDGQREDDRRRFVDQQRTLPDAELIEDERGVRYRFESNDEDAAVMRANTLRNGFCREAGIDPDRVHVSLEPPEYQPAPAGQE
ncbi:MAG: hypothetical protein QOK00_872 [Thermoleophilaceae bacterium]|jgi:hypothetical protein|nr:hypothetical protein [Thermoleophilaceae bacterium]MEA2454883.1 hypothetical protein [Thermoleophilaceae bacterium]